LFLLEYLLCLLYDYVQSVLSGQCQPDEITVRRSWDDQLSIERTVIGNKKQNAVAECM